VTFYEEGEMKKIGLTGRIAAIFLIIAAAAVMAGCATPTPKLYVPESELPKTKFNTTEVATHKNFGVKDGEFTRLDNRLIIV